MVHLPVRWCFASSAGFGGWFAFFFLQDFDFVFDGLKSIAGAGVGVLNFVVDFFDSIFGLRLECLDAGGMFV